MAKSKMVFVDVDTQADFIMPGGKLYVPGAEGLLPELRRLRDHAAQNGIAVLSTTDAHSTDDPEFQFWPSHCVRQTPGQLKVPETLFPDYLVVPRERSEPVSDQELGRYGQIIVEKNQLDMFTSPHADSLVQRFDAGQYVVYGVATDYCVRLAALGLRRRRRNVLLLTDAVCGVDPGGVKRAMQEFKDAGVVFVAVGELLAAAA